MLTVPLHVLTEAAQVAPDDAWLAKAVESHRSWSSSDVTMTSSDLTDARLQALVQAAKNLDAKPFHRVVEAIASTRDGQFTKSVPRLDALPEMLRAFLNHHKVDGWLYRQGKSGVEAFLVTSITYDDGDPRTDDKPHVIVALARTGLLGKDSGRGRGIHTKTITLYGSDATKKKVADIITNEGYLVETPALRAEYDRLTEHHRTVLTTGFTEQYLYTGMPLSVSDESGRGYSRDYDTSPRSGRKVIDITPTGDIAIAETAMSSVFSDENDAEESDPGDRYGKKRNVEVAMPVPMVHNIQVFDLATHEFMTVASGHLTRYEYDSSLADKLVLPPSHRDLLDILTTDIATFTGDIIEGKSAGNVILAKGEPGVGKTLTAEVYSELIERPLYSIHSGSLGVSADSVRKNLETVFKRAKAWNAVLLLDEADVFVNARGNNITQNAIVAEFLRTMEYFDGLMFMTTNRAANIDEAVISRCAAIIDYRVPGPKDAARIWQVLAAQFTGGSLDETLVGDLVAGYGHIAPRDIKMLLRLALRVSKAKSQPLSVQLFEQVGMFRGLSFDDEKYAAHLDQTGRG